MKLLFDQNLSFKLCQALADLFPNSSQVRLLGLAEADDTAIWQYAIQPAINRLAFAAYSTILGTIKRPLAWAGALRRALAWSSEGRTSSERATFTSGKA